jgi:hypothetical protein
MVSSFRASFRIPSSHPCSFLEMSRMDPKRLERSSTDCACRSIIFDQIIRSGKTCTGCTRLRFDPDCSLIIIRPCARSRADGEWCARGQCPDQTDAVTPPAGNSSL